MLEKAAPNRRSHRPFQADARPLNRFGQFFGNVFMIFFEGFAAGCEALPFEFHAGSFKECERWPE